VLLNLYLSRLGFTIEIIGLVNMAGALGFAISAIPAGVMGLRFGAGKMVVLGFSGGALSTFLMPFAQSLGADSWQAIIIASYGLFGISMTVIGVNIVPFLAGSTADDNRVHVFSAYSALGSLAGFSGSLAAGILPGLFARLARSSLDLALPYALPLYLVPSMFVIMLPIFAHMTGTAVKHASQSPGTRRKRAEDRMPFGLLASSP
jgi:MFS family permease